jgi:transposase InsO family protein
LNGGLKEYAKVYSLCRLSCKRFYRIAFRVYLSRTSINNVLRKHKLNGYKKLSKGWKFFRAKKPDELWQLDIKGPFTVQGKKYWFVVCIDDYSRYLLTFEQLDYDPGTEDIEDIKNILLPLFNKHKPEKILTDNGKQFKESWEKFLKKQDIEPLFAHPYYPQDKGKVERTIRNVAEEFVYLQSYAPLREQEIPTMARWADKGISGVV